MADPRLASFIDRILRLREERKEINADIRDVKAEAKAVGYDAKVIDLVVKRAEMDPEAKFELDAMVEVYEIAISEARGSAEPVTKDPALAAIAGGQSKTSAAKRLRAAKLNAWLEGHGG